MKAMLRRNANYHDLTDEIQWLGELLDAAIVDIIGDDGLQLINAIRRLSMDHREGIMPAGERLQALLSTLTFEQLRLVIRVLTVFLDLTNVAEDRHRLRVLRDRASELGPQPRNESIAAALLQLKDSGKSADEVRELLD